MERRNGIDSKWKGALVVGVLTFLAPTIDPSITKNRNTFERLFSNPLSSLVYANGEGKETKGLQVIGNIRELRLSRVFPNPPGDDAGKEWIEIKNTSPEPISLLGYSLKGNSGCSPLPGQTIPAGESLAFTDTNLGFGFVNAGDEIELLSIRQEVVDSFAWTNAQSGKIFVVEGEEVFPAEAQVVHVVDGDTFDVEFPDGRTERIRLKGVDTPETKDPKRPVQPYGTEASAYTRKTLEGKRVRLVYPKDKRGEFGRLLAYVYLTDGESEIFFNEELIRLGYARYFNKYPCEFEEHFRAVQDEAKANRRGLWEEVGKQEKDQKENGREKKPGEEDPRENPTPQPEESGWEGWRSRAGWNFLGLFRRSG